MWDALPPVVPSSATPADELTGVHVATHTYGMLSGNPATALPASYPLSAPTHRSRSSGGNLHSSATRSPGTASISLVSAVTATGPPNSNPFATPRDGSLTSLGAGGVHRDLSARSNVAASPSSSQLLPVMMVSSTPLQLPSGVEGVDGRQGSNVGVPATVAAASVVGGGGATLSEPLHPRPLSSTSTNYANARYATGSQPVKPAPTAAPAAVAAVAAAGTSSISESVSFAGYAPPVASSPPPQHASAFSPTVRSRDPSAVFIARSVSPRYAYGTLDSAAEVSRSAAGPVTTTSASASTASTAAPWESPGSISIGSARLNNEPTSLYFSPGMPDSARESVSRGGGRTTSAASLGAQVSSSTARGAIYNTPDYRRQLSFSSRGGGGGALPEASSAAAVRLDSAPLQVEAASASTPVTSASGGAAASFSRPSHAVETPTMARQDGLSNSNPYAVGTSTSSLSTGGPSTTRVPLHPTAVVPVAKGGETSSGNGGSSMPMASGTSFTSLSPHFQAASTALDESLMTSTMSVTAAPPQAGITTAARLSGAVPFSEANTVSLPLPNSHLLCPVTSTAATTTTTRPATTKSAHPMGSASGSQHSGSVPARAPFERTSTDVVRMVRTGTSSPSDVHTSELSADVRHRYTLPPGLQQHQQQQQVSGSPANSVLTPCHSAAAGPAPVFSPYTPPAMPAAAAEGAAAPFTPPQPAMEGGRHHVSIALSTDYPRRVQEACAQQQQQQQGLPLFAAQSIHHGGVRCSGTAETADGLHVSPGVAGSIDHNQSFYLGTTGNGNLRRSFFFPPGARLPPGEWEDGVNGSVGRCGSVECQTAEDTASPNFDLASYLRQVAAVDRQNTSLPPVAAPAAAAAAAAGISGGAPSVSSAPPLLMQHPNQQQQQQQSPSTSTEQTEATEGERYCSPVLYCVSSFSNASPSQPALTRLPLQLPSPQLPSVPFKAAIPVGMVETVTPTGGCVQRVPSSLPPAPLWPQSQSTQPTVYASPLAQSQRSSLPEEPLNVNMMAGDRPRLAVTLNSVGGGGASTVSASSPHTRTSSIGGGGGVPKRGTSTRRTGAGESVPNTTISTTNASFLSPTLANSMLRRRFEDSVASVSETSSALTESSGQATGQAATARQASGTVAPPSLAATTRPTASSSLAQTPQKAATTSAPPPPPPPVGPGPPYVLEWERSLVAFQNRAESYYAFKNLCTETYLTLVEHDVDRFLVCYYSGGAMRPEEAVQEAMVSRAGTPAAVNANILSSTGGKSGSAPRNDNGGGGVGGLQKMIQTNKTLQRLSEAGSKWFTTLKRTALTPAPPRADTRTPSSSLGTATPVRGGGSGGRSGASSVNSGLADHLASTHPPRQLPALDQPPPRNTEQDGEEWWMATHDECSNDNNASGEPAYSTAMDPLMKRSAPLPLPLRPQGTTAITGTTTDVAQLLDRPLSSSGRSLTNSTTSADAFSTGSSSVVGAPLAVSTPKKAPALSRLSYNIAAEEELQCLRQLGAYMANVIPENYMEARPSEQVLHHVRCNHPIILNALQHALMLSGADSATLESPARSGNSTSSSRHAAEAAKVLIASRLRQGLLLPSIQATWRDYLSPLEMKVKELVHIAEKNIDPILAELEGTPTEDTAAAAAEKEGNVSALADLQARQRLRALHDQPVRRLSRLLRGDEEYLGAIHVMDDEFIENGEAWQTRSATMRRAGAALSDYVPVYGLVLSRLHRLEIEHRTVLELWCGGV